MRRERKDGKGRYRKKDGRGKRGVQKEGKIYNKLG